MIYENWVRDFHLNRALETYGSPTNSFTFRETPFTCVICNIEQLTEFPGLH